jgi:methionyl aminopeptidase
MREAGRIVAQALKRMSEVAAPGVSTYDLDAAAEETIREAGGEPCFNGQAVGDRVYRWTICASVNDAVVHGIPSRDVVLRDGDIVGIDVGVRYEEYHGDAAVTLAIGEIDDRARRLMEVTERSRDLGIEAAQVGSTVGDVARVVEGYVTQAGFSAVRELCGHGIGRSMWEPPNVPNVASVPNNDLNLTLRPGMTIAIEPMINEGRPDVRTDEDGWTVRTADGTRSAHFEHTVAVTRDGPVILTALEEDA